MDGRPEKPVNLPPASGSMRALLDSGVDGVLMAATAAGHQKLLPGMMQERRDFKAAKAAQAKRAQGYTKGTEVVHAPSHQRLMIEEANVDKTSTGEPVHLCKTLAGDKVKVPQRNLELI